MAEYYNRNPNTNCAVCNKPIYKRPSQINRGKVYCSNNCYGVSCRREIPCIVCGKAILSGLHKKTCSRSCSNVNRAGIIYSHKKPRDKVFQHRTLRNELILGRGGKCERCSYAKTEILQIHHKNRNREDNSSKNLELICPNCHFEEHIIKK